MTFTANLGAVDYRLANEWTARDEATRFACILATWQADHVLCDHGEPILTLDDCAQCAQEETNRS